MKVWAIYHVTNALQDHAWPNSMEIKLVHVDIAFSMIFWRLLQAPKYINVIMKVVLTFAYLDVSTTCADIHVVALLRLSFRLSDEVGLRLTFPFVLALLVKVNKVFGGAAITGPMSL